MNDTEEFANYAIEDLEKFIDKEKQHIEQDHDFHTKISAWDSIFIHLIDIIPQEEAKLYDLNLEMSDALRDLRDYIEAQGGKTMHIVSEERELEEQLKEDIKHHKWKAVKKDIQKERDLEKHTIILNKEELQTIHQKFLVILGIFESITQEMFRAKRGTKDASLSKTLEEVEHYFGIIHDFVRTYEHVFSDLLKKEKRLLKQIS